MTGVAKGFLGVVMLELEEATMSELDTTLWKLSTCCLLTSIARYGSEFPGREERKTPGCLCTI